jgi:hypothetical protein
VHTQVTAVRVSPIRPSPSAVVGEIKAVLISNVLWVFIKTINQIHVTKLLMHQINNANDLVGPGGGEARRSSEPAPLP